MTRMKDSGIEWIGEVPEEWGTGKIKYYSEISAGSTPDRTNELFWNGDIPWMASGEVNQGVVTHTAEKITKLGLRNTSAKLLSKGTVMLALNGQGKTKGTAAILNIETASNQSLASFDVNNEVVNGYYLYYYFVANYSNIRGLKGEDRDGLNLKLVSNIEIPLPNIDEQLKIADFLDKKVAQLDKVKSLLEEQIATLQNYRQSLIYETVTKGLYKTVPMKDSGVDWIGQVPEGWGVKPIKYCSRFQRGFGFPVELQGNDDGEIPFYKVSDLRGNSDEISISKNYVDLQTAKQNAWVIVPSGAIIAPVIGAALLNNNRKISTVPFISDNNTLAIIPNNKNKYFYYLFKVIDMNWFNNSSTIPAVNISKLANQIVPTPKEEEQKQIADFLEVQIIKIDKLIEIKQKQINNINQQRQTLIYDVVTGKRRV